MSFIDYVEINPSIKLEKGKEYPFIEMSSVDFYAREPQKIDIKKYLSGVKFQRGDTVISRIEPCLQNGKSFFVKNISEGFGSTEFLVFRPKDKKVNNEFLYYFMLTDSIRKNMINSMTGATGRQRVNNDIFKSLEISLPSIKKQKRIANILSTYDDLIENNQKQIKLLEEAAMMLYKEWFVNLRFPGYETTKIVDGVPEGWKKGKTKDFISFNYGKALKAESRKGSRYPVYGSSGVIGYHGEYLVKGPVIIVGRKGNVGNTYISFENAYPIDTVYYINSKLNLYYTYFNLLLRSFVNNDSAVPGLNRNYAESTEMIAPSDLLMNMFNDKVLSIFGKQNILRSQINLLQQARDKLLPKLISGEIDIPEE